MLYKNLDFVLNICIFAQFLFSLYASQIEENSREEEDKECTVTEGNEDEEQNSQRRGKTAWRCNQENREILIDEPGELVSDFEKKATWTVFCHSD